MERIQLNDDAARALVKAIVQNAIYEYHHYAKNTINRYRSKGVTDPDELVEAVVKSNRSAMRWFRSQWFYELTGVEGTAAERAFRRYITKQVEKLQ